MPFHVFIQNYIIWRGKFSFSLIKLGESVTRIKGTMPPHPFPSNFICCNFSLLIPANEGHLFWKRFPLLNMYPRKTGCLRSIWTPVPIPYYLFSKYKFNFSIHQWMDKENIWIHNDGMLFNLKKEENPVICDNNR
jgi:hypothetical protein